jgi:hypothetical protein
VKSIIGTVCVEYRWHHQYETELVSVLQFYWILGQYSFDVNDRTDSEAELSIEVGRDRQLLSPVADLKAQWKRKGKEGLHGFFQNTKRERRGSYFERYHRNGSAAWFREIKINCRAFVSINRMRGGHSILKPTKKTKLRGSSRQANYTHRATAAYRRSYCRRVYSSVA